MRKKLLLLLAAVTVATTLGRETSLVSATTDQIGSLAFLPPKQPRVMSLAFLPPKQPRAVSLAFLQPKQPRVVSLAFLPPKQPRSVSLAFLPPKQPRSVSLAFLSPSRLGPANNVLDLRSNVLLGKLAMLPLGTETGRHIPNAVGNNKESEKAAAANAPKTAA